MKVPVFSSDLLFLHVTSLLCGPLQLVSEPELQSVLKRVFIVFYQDHKPSYSAYSSLLPLF